MKTKVNLGESVRNKVKNLVCSSVSQSVSISFTSTKYYLVDRSVYTSLKWSVNNLVWFSVYEIICDSIEDKL
jgi:hypothetical protein